MTGFVSLGRIERFLDRSEVLLPPPHGQQLPAAMTNNGSSQVVTWGGGGGGGGGLSGLSGLGVPRGGVRARGVAFR